MGFFGISNIQSCQHGNRINGKSQFLQSSKYKLTYKEKAGTTAMNVTGRNGNQMTRAGRQSWSTMTQTKIRLSRANSECASISA